VCPLGSVSDMLQLVGVEEIVTVAATDRQAEAYRTHPTPDI